MGKLLTWAVGAKAAAPVKAASGSHRPSRCHDQGCLRPLCVAFKDGYEAGHDYRYEDGYRAGSAAGYAAGQAAGQKG